MKIPHFIYLVSSITLLAACNRNSAKSDAYGNFESTEITVASEATGKIVSLNIEEGQLVDSGSVLGYIDTLQLHLRKGQLAASRSGVASRTGNIVAQMDVLNEQKKVLEKEYARFSKLLKDSAATQKQVDDLNGQIAIISEQIKSIETQHAPVASELKSIDSQLAQLDDQVNKSVIRSPIKGTVLVKYAEAGEVSAFGKPLFKIADMENMILRVYISGLQLPSVKTGQAVKVLYDKTEKDNNELPGEISWISGTAEFTPKIIQTKEERVNMVYALKIKLKNNGALKIGMPGEVLFTNGK